MNDFFTAVGYIIVVFALAYFALKIKDFFTAEEQVKKDENWPPEVGDKVTLTKQNQEYECEVLWIEKPKKEKDERDLWLAVRVTKTGRESMYQVRPDFTISDWAPIS